MHPLVSILVVATFLCAGAPNVNAQQSNTPTFINTYESVVAKARETCTTLWSDHAFDPLRDKIPLGEEKPTFAMLKNSEKLKVKERPLAELAIKTLEKCREAYADVYATLPPQVSAMIHGVERRQDSVVAEIYRGKLTFGEFNIAMNRLNGELASALSGVQTMQPTSAPREATKDAVATRTAQLPKLEQKEKGSIVAPHETRLALVIGNSGYINLPKLSNPANDARAVADELAKMGYQTRLLLDATEQKIRREVRQFASDSTKAEVALVFYAGHGAQVNGNNYLLPTDMDIPRTEVDIQFAGLKVDDLVNSIGSNTKIVFLDACRDNPVLFKNLVKGRGSSPTGLAPASSVNFDQKSGGGVFIAYATDAGAVADDGNGKHSPFTQALLRNIQKRISIDDMFSLVTKEVRLVTKNAQRPYKYASLENIICVAPNCSNSAVAIKGDVFQQAVQSESDELQIAMQTNNSEALETYLQKYPDSSQRSEILGAISNLKRSEFTEWTLHEIGDRRLPQYIQLSSIQRVGDRSVARLKAFFDPTKPKIYRGKTFPDAAYQEQIFVYDCTTPIMASTEDFIFNAAGELLFHYKWGDPRYLKISTVGFAVEPGTIGYTARNIACNETLGTPLVSKKQMAGMNFTSLSSTEDGTGEIFYEPAQRNRSDPNQIEVIIVFKNFSDRNVKEFFPEGMSIPDPPNYRQEVDRVLIKCDTNKYVITKTEFWDASNHLVRMSVGDPSATLKFSEFGPGSPSAALQDIFCQNDYAGIGVRLADDKGSIVAAEVFEGSPAAKAGVAANDIVSHIDNEPVSGLTPQKVTEKIRGPANTKVVLRIVRKGQNDPVELSITREIVKRKSVEGVRK
jgi:Caspase domain/PDZ domain